MVILNFCLSYSCLQPKRYLSFEVRLDWEQTSKMEKIQHATCSLRHSRQSWAQPRRNLNIIERSFSRQSLTRTTARFAENTSATMMSMLSTRFTGKRWIKTNSADISKDLSRIFKLFKKGGSKEPDLLIRKRRILRTPLNKELRKLSWRNQSSEPFQ